MELKRTSDEAVSLYLLNAGLSRRATAKFLQRSIGLSAATAHGVTRYTPSMVSALMDRQTASRLINSLEALGAIAVAGLIGEDFPTRNPLLRANLNRWYSWIKHGILILVAVVFFTTWERWISPHSDRSIRVSFRVDDLFAVVWPLFWITTVKPLEALFTRTSLLRSALRIWNTDGGKQPKEISSAAAPLG